MATARTHPLILEMNFGLPPGTDSLEQYEQRPRMPQPPPKPHRELPPWPPRSTRRGHWIEKYLDEVGDRHAGASHVLFIFVSAAILTSLQLDGSLILRLSTTT